MRVLIITDGSEASRQALKFGAQFSESSGQYLTVLTIVSSASERDWGKTVLRYARELFSNQFPKMQMKIRIGQASEEILKEVKDGQFELVVFGDPGIGGTTRGLLKRFGILNVVEKVPCSVLVVKGPYRSIRKVLLCDSGVEGSSLPGRYVVRYVDLSEQEEEVTILHVMSQISAGPGIKGRFLRAGAEDLIQENTPEGRALERNIEILKQPLIRSYPKIRHGFVVDEILDEAKAGDYDLVMIGAHRREGWWGLLLDDLAQKIILQIDRSILIVP
jgi:nucleotide-binding universal stress UspA family protein